MAKNACGRQNGQVLVLFVLALIAMVSMVGLVLDGGGTYAQRRGQQNAADLAALAGANALIFNQDHDAAAKRVALDNGYDDASPEVIVTVLKLGDNQVQVDITAPHENAFAGIAGQPTWQVTVTATAEEGIPTGSLTGNAPIIFSSQAFDPLTGLPYAPYGCSAPPCTPVQFGVGNGDIPLAPNDIAWTLYGPNVDTNDVRPYIAGIQTFTLNFAVNDYIGQSNNGNHTALYGDDDGALDSRCDGGTAHTNVDDCLSGKDVIVPIVSPEGTTCNGGENGGCFLGWALFHVDRADGTGPVKTISGYFVSGFTRVLGDLTHCDTTNTSGCAGFHGLYGLRLIK